MSSGLKSTEFYLTISSLIVGLLTMTGLLSPEKSGEVTELIVQAIGGIVALGTLISYILSRTQLKETQMKLEAQKLQG